jgi:hypothetical protein
MNFKDLEAFLAANPSPTEVEVGRFYRVPCARHNRGSWLPLIGPIHEDREIIGFKPVHVHVDSRFVHDSYGYTWWPSTDMIKLGKPLSLTFNWSEAVLPGLQFQAMRRMCRRKALCWQPVKFTRELEAVYQGCRIGPDGICPHRKIPLALGARLQDGSTVCAGHGLRWSAEGELLPLEDPSPSTEHQA